MSDMADVLDEHVQSGRNQRCSCGWRGDLSKSITDPENLYWQHRNHVAAMLSAAGFGPVREAKAEAWDEGFDRGFYDPLAGSSRDASESPATNPYRAATVRGEG